MGRTAVVRRAAILCSAALLGAGLSAGGSSAAPTPDAGLPAPLVAAISHDLKLTGAQYLQRAETAQRLGAFQETARREFASVFAGAWLDNDGRANVALTNGPARAAAGKAVAAAGFVARDAAKSEATLQREKVEFGKWVAGQPANVASAVRGVVIDTINNALAVRVDKMAAGLQLPGYIDPSHIITTKAPVAGEVIPQATAVAQRGGGPIVGGAPYAARMGSRALRCSSGFNGTDGAGVVVNITAGHCNPNIPAAGKPNSPVIDAVYGNSIAEPLGTFQKSVLSNRDYSIVRVNPQSVGRFQNNLVGVPGAPPIAIDGVAVPVVGMPACKAGSRTGFSCGTVNAVDQTVQVGDRQLAGSFSMNICALPGDSGGPVVTGRRALGISSASSVADFPVCEIPNFLGLITGEWPQLFAQPIATVLAENPGLKVKTN